MTAVQFNPKSRSVCEVINKQTPFFLNFFFAQIESARGAILMFSPLRFRAHDDCAAGESSSADEDCRIQTRCGRQIIISGLCNHSRWRIQHDQ